MAISADHTRCEDTDYVNMNCMLYSKNHSESNCDFFYHNLLLHNSAP